MTTNREWLYSLDVADLSDWFDAEHVEHKERALDGDTEPESEDSREQLEAEIESYSAFDIMDTITLDMVIGWLDRQAAITERECRKPNWDYCETCEALEKLTAERDNWKEHSRTIEYRCKKAETDCEIYRKKFGKCIDYADAIHALMDDEGMA